MTGKFVDGPANADVSKNREADWKAHQKGFFGNAPLTTLARSTLCILFREGNTRAQREFIRELAVGSRLWDCVGPRSQDEMLAGSVASFHRGSSEEFATILNKIIRPVRWIPPDSQYPTRSRYQIYWALDVVLLCWRSHGTFFGILEQPWSVLFLVASFKAGCRLAFCAAQQWQEFLDCQKSLFLGWFSPEMGGEGRLRTPRYKN